MILAGFPAATTFGGISFTTTEPAPINEFFPILRSGSMVAFAPIFAFL